MLRKILAALTLLLLASPVPGCSRPLPEANSEAAHIYVKRCGQCHRAYDPRSLSEAMWEVQLTMMELKMRQMRIAPLTDQERETIADYLTRNAAR